MWTKKGLWEKNKKLNCRMWLGISMGTCGKKFRIFDPIDFEIIAFEGRRKHFFGPCPTGSTGFDSPLCQKLELYKVELLEIHNEWKVK
jgi:hypothetical protein